MPIPNPERGKCATCAFLCLRGGPEPVRECEQWRRDSGNAYDLRGVRFSVDGLPAQEGYRVEPHCFLGVADFRKQIGSPFIPKMGKEIAKDDPIMVRTLVVLRSDRKCPHWWQYRPGEPPPKAVDAMRGDMLSRLDAQDRRIARLSIWFTLMGVVVGAGAVLIGIVALVPERIREQWFYQITGSHQSSLPAGPTPERSHGSEDRVGDQDDEPQPGGDQDQQ
jgi:hypothetical protein